VTTGCRLRQLTLFLAATMLPGFAYEYPLSSTTIREAYLAGSATKGTREDFFSQYTHTLPELRVGTYASAVTIETPYVQVAEYSRRAVNYKSQDAVADFLSKPPSVFRVQLDICRGRKELDSVKFRITQNDKELVPSFVEHSPYFAEQRHGPSVIIGEHAKLQFQADMIESTPLTVEIETPDGLHARTTFDLAKLR
jgi:hypothetical protein